MSRCVVIDVGNTSTGLALYAHGRLSRVTHLRGGVSASREKAAEALRATVGRGKLPDGAILGSVVPRDVPAWTRILRAALGDAPLIVSSRLRLPVKLDYPHPGRIGADRIANASGGFVRYGAPLIVADFGTALTFDAIDARGAYIGGVIAPGLAFMTEYLHEKTALLPRIALQGPCPPVGRSTRGAMKIGAEVGYRGIVRETVAHLKKTLGPEATLCATGGFARWALRGLDIPCILDPNLTLYGLGLIFENNRE